MSSEKISMPGPGNYDQPSHIGKGPAPSMRGRPDPQRDDNLPGPGHYDANVEAVKDKSQNSFRIGTHKRDFLSMSSQDLSKPGPGFYDVKDMSRGPAYSIKGRQSERHDNSKPGPG